MRRHALGLRLTSQLPLRGDLPRRPALPLMQHPEPKLMKRRLLALATFAFLSRMALAAEPAELSVYLFDAGTPVADAEIRIDDASRGRTSSDGALNLKIEPGARTLRVLREGVEVLKIELNLVEDENAELIATLYPDAAPSVFIESTNTAGAAASSATQDLGPPGTLSGRVVSADNGQPVVGARVYVSGTPIDLVTDAEGRFSAPISAGSYAISVLAPNFSSRSFEGVQIVSEQTTEQAIELTPAGVELPEFVVLEPFIEGSLASFVEERRTSSAVTDILGAEQISRAGDSDAAGALKRVTGLTLVDGKFVYVRGLGERYSSTLLNGAQVPSPDPTRRVVPLDLFPTEVLQGIVVQKTYSADMPGEFGGGTIQLRTRGVPESFFFRTSVSMGYADGTTGEEGLRYDGGRRDWTGQDDGARYAPLVFGSPRLTTNPTEVQAASREIAALGYDTRRASLAPNGSVGVGVGDDFRFGDSGVSLGYIAAVRYAHSWDTNIEERKGYSLFQGGLLPAEEFTREKTERSIDGSVFAALGLRVGEHHSVDFTATRLRQSSDETRVDEGLLNSGTQSRVTLLEWIENSLDTLQLQGEHSFPAIGGLHLRWQATQAEAGRYSPNARSYTFEFDDLDQVYRHGGINQQRFEQLDDEASDYSIDLRLPLELGAFELAPQIGAARLERDRVSSIRRFRFSGRTSDPHVTMEDLLRPENIGPNGWRLAEVTETSDAYSAVQQLDAAYIATDVAWGPLRLNAGVRREEMRQEVITVPPFNPNAEPVVGLLENRDYLPAGSLTWSYSEKAQVRLGFSETLSRPDIREQTSANFFDPLTDTRVVGNANLKQAQLENIDVRWEYYFNTLESFSIALFSKEFTNPIELVSSPASGELLQIENADSATNIGIEFDVYRSLDAIGRVGLLPGFLKRLPWQDVYFGANYSRIDSEIDLGENQGIQTNAVRPLQGQSKYVANASVSYQPTDGNTEATLLYNVFGERIFRVGVSGLPDVYEQPFHQLDLTVSHKLPWEGFGLKLRLRNLLDGKVEFTQGGLPTRSYRKGREAGFSVEWKF
jgi:hypothetical protein